MNDHALIEKLKASQCKGDSRFNEGLDAAIAIIRSMGEDMSQAFADRIKLLREKSCHTEAWIAYDTCLNIWYQHTQHGDERPVHHITKNGCSICGTDAQNCRWFKENTDQEGECRDAYERETGLKWNEIGGEYAQDHFVGGWKAAMKSSFSEGDASTRKDEDGALNTAPSSTSPTKQQNHEAVDVNDKNVVEMPEGIEKTGNHSEIRTTYDEAVLEDMLRDCIEFYGYSNPITFSKALIEVVRPYLRTSEPVSIEHIAKLIMGTYTSPDEGDAGTLYIYEPLAMEIAERIVKGVKYVD